MSTDFFKDFYSMFNFFDLVFLIILIYFTIQCAMKGFTLSLISFMKWVLSTIITIILVPKAQPLVGEYVKSDFVNKKAGMPLPIIPIMNKGPSFFLGIFIIIVNIIPSS